MGALRGKPGGNWFRNLGAIRTVLRYDARIIIRLGWVVAVMLDVEERSLTSKVIATVDIPDIGSIRVLEKLNFDFQGQIEAYGSDNMYLYTKETGD